MKENMEFNVGDYAFLKDGPQECDYEDTLPKKYLVYRVLGLDEDGDVLGKCICGQVDAMTTKDITTVSPLFQKALKATHV